MESVDLTSFDTIQLLGSGSCGSVFLVEKHDDHCKYAMKVTKKDSKNALHNAIIEQDILVHLHHPFIITLHYSWQKDAQMYIVMPYCECGNFYNFMKRQKYQCFTEEQTKYYASCILLALEYLHSVGIVYIDLKPENILVCASGRIMLSDFDLSVYNKDKIIRKTFKTSHDEIGVVVEPNVVLYGKAGTPEYIAPESIENKPYTCIVDWWSLGILIYEMLYGITPFYHKDISEIYKLISKCHLTFPRYTPLHYKLSHPCKSLIKSLLKHDPNKRLGYNGAVEIKGHSFFEDVEFQLLRNKIPPIIP